MSPPDPLTPPGCNLRAFGDFPFDIGRFQKSDLVLYEEPEAILAALNLWCAAWHEVPAASVPNDDRWLAKQAGYGRATEAWLAVRDGALRGFVLCADGRLYNRTLSEKALKAWDARLKYLWERERDLFRKAQASLPEDRRAKFMSFETWKANRAPDVSDGTGEQFQGNDPSIPSENAHKERKGKESKESTLTTSLSPEGVGGEIDGEDADAGAPGAGDDPVEGEAPPVPVGSPTAGKDRFDAACAAAGLNLISPAHIATAHDLLREWEKAGIDFDAIVLPTIKAVTADSPDPSWSLLRFDKKIRHEHARSGAKGASGKKYTPPASPILEPDGEDELFRPLRAALLKAFGPAEFTRYVNPVRFEQVDDRKVLRVAESRKGPMRLMDDGREVKVRAAAARLGWEDVW